jgi:hypothetical protein
MFFLKAVTKVGVLRRIEPLNSSYCNSERTVTNRIDVGYEVLVAVLHESGHIPGYTAVWSLYQPTFQINVSVPSSG